MNLFYKFSLVCTIAALVVFVPPSLAADEGSDSNKVSKAKKPKKITDRNHPDYRRCRSEPIIGSLARKRRVCMTNRQWAEANREGNRKSRQFVEDMLVGSNTSN